MFTLFAGILLFLVAVNSAQETTIADLFSTLHVSQSPIAIPIRKCTKWTTLDRLNFQNYWNNISNATLVNTGHTARFTFDNDSSRPVLSGGFLEGEYIFEQMHFHWSYDDYTGSEHIVDGIGYAAECHMVHYNSKYSSLEEAEGYEDGAVVVSFMLELTDLPNPLLQKLAEGFAAIQKPDAEVQLHADSLLWMDREDLYTGPYVTYRGSLTTSPYYECVKWIIYQTPVEVGYEQLNFLQNLEASESQKILRNVRQTQIHPLGDCIYVEPIALNFCNASTK